MSSSLRKISTEKFSLRNARNIRIGIAVSEWHADITEKLYYGAEQSLLKNGILKNNITRRNAAGSFELPIIAQQFLKNKYDAVICLGCVIKGETDHFHFISNAVANGIMNVSLAFNKPVAFGVLTTNNLSQALSRAGGKHGNKGEEAAITVLKTLC